MILLKYTNFLDRIFKKIQQYGIDVSNFELDHIAYTTSSKEEYDKLKNEFAKLGKLKSENLVGGRRVGIYKLFKKLTYKNFLISGLELIEPENSKKVASGLEHAEFIINTGFEEFMNKYPDLPWNKDHLKRTEFPRLKLDLGDGLEIKFHLASILSSSTLA